MHLIIQFFKVMPTFGMSMDHLCEDHIYFYFCSHLLRHLNWFYHQPPSKKQSITKVVHEMGLSELIECVIYKKIDFSKKLGVPHPPPIGLPPVALILLVACLNNKTCLDQLVVSTVLFIILFVSFSYCGVYWLKLSFLFMSS